jgi:hypothetical protein
MANTAITISPTRVTPLSEQEVAATGFNARFRVLSTDILYGTGATDTVTVTLGATPAKWYIDKAGVNISTAFAGITVASIIVGTTSSTAALTSSASILTAAFLNQTVGTPVLTNTTATASVNLVATFTAAGTGGPAALTAGQLDIYLNLVNTALLP